jgi:chaperonin GroEL (HSP60 family)
MIGALTQSFNCLKISLLLFTSDTWCYFSLYQRANDLVRNKIHPTSIISGYRVSL